MQEHIIASELGPWDREMKTGFYRLVMVRVMKTAQIMVAIQADPESVPDEKLSAEKESLITLFKEKTKVSSLLLQKSSDFFVGFKEEHGFELLYGDEFVYEEILELK